MVWIITGNLVSRPDDQPNSKPIPTSHYLRPSRSYQLGRAYFDSPAGWTKRHLYDWKAKSTVIPKEGAFTVKLGDWTEENATDDPSNEHNLDPYTCSISFSKKASQVVEGAEHPLDPNTLITVKDGDEFRFCKEWNVKFTWKPYILCISFATAAQKAVHLSTFTPFGLKLAFKTLLPHHTHYLTKSLTPSQSLCYASIVSLPILSHSFLNSLKSIFTISPRPEKYSALPPDSTEKQVFALIGKGEEDEPGSEWNKWWGKSLAEENWEDYGLREGDEEGGWEVEDETGGKDGWKKVNDEKMVKGGRDRRGLFESVLVVSFRGEDEETVDKNDSDLILAGSGHFFSTSLLESSTTTSETILSAISDFKEDQHLSEEDLKIILIPPTEVDIEGDSTEAVMLKEVAESLGVKKWYNATEFIDSIIEANISTLFSPSSETQQPEIILAPPTNPSSLATNTGVGPSSFQSAPGTHPEQETLLPPLRRNAKTVIGGNPNQGGTEVGGSGVEKEKEKEVVVEVVVPPPVRKLTRRTKTASTSAAVMDVDDFWGTPPTSISTSAQVVGREPKTQGDEFNGISLEEEESGSTAGGGGGAGEKEKEQEVVNNLIDDSFEVPATQKPRLKRRAGKTQESMFDSALEDDDNFKKVKKARAGGLESVLEDEELSTSGGQKRGAATQDESDDGEEGSGGRRKRVRSESVDEPDYLEVMKEREKERERVAEKEREKEKEREEKEKEEREKAKTSMKKAPKKAVGGKKGAKDKEKALEEEEARVESEKEKAKLLQIKSSKRKGEGAALDAAFNDDFNALKIVRPALTKMVPPKRDVQGWDENDPEEELQRVIRREQDDREERRKEREDWGGADKATNFVLVMKDMRKKGEERVEGRLVENEKWKGRVDFKKFQPKNSTTPRVPRQERVLPKLVISDRADFGLGPAYDAQPKILKKKAGKGRTKMDSDSDDDMADSDGQTKLSFKPKPKPKASTSTAKGKSKSKADASSDQDSDEEMQSSNTLKDEMDVDSDDSIAIGPSASISKRKSTSQASKAKASTSTATKGKGKASTSKAAPATTKPVRKAVQAPIVLDDTDDSDDGLTFKGFGRSTAVAGVKRKR